MPWPHCTSTHPNALILSGIEHQRVAYRGKSDAKLLTISLTAKQFSKKLCLREIVNRGAGCGFHFSRKNGNFAAVMKLGFDNDKYLRSPYC